MSVSEDVPRRVWTNEHGPDRVYSKFMVQRVSTGEFLNRNEEFFFVLRPESDEAACEALLLYADEVAERSPELARQIRVKVDLIIKANT